MICCVGNGVGAESFDIYVVCFIYFLLSAIVLNYVCKNTFEIAFKKSASL